MVVVRLYPNALAIECPDEVLGQHLIDACEGCGLDIELSEPGETIEGADSTDQLWTVGSEMEDSAVEEVMWTLLLIVQKQVREWVKNHSELLELTIECFDFHRFADQSHEEAKKAR